MTTQQGMLADKIRSGELELIFCHPDGKFPALSASQEQRDLVEAALRQAAAPQGRDASAWRWKYKDSKGPWEYATDYPEFASFNLDSMDCEALYALIPRAREALTNEELRTTYVCDQGCSNYLGEDDIAVCALAADGQTCSCLETVSNLRELIEENLLRTPAAQAHEPGEDVYRLRDLIASHIACQEDCEKYPSGCGCALTAARTIASLPSRQGREEIARIIDPDAMQLYDKYKNTDVALPFEAICRVNEALAKADAILALRPER